MEIHVSGDVDADMLAQELSDGLGETITVMVVDPSGEPRIAVPPMVSDVQKAVRIVRSHRTADQRQLEMLVEKARNVWAGNDSFTQAQAQKILAGLVLVVSRRLS